MLIFCALYEIVTEYAQTINRQNEEEADSRRLSYII